MACLAQDIETTGRRTTKVHVTSHCRHTKQTYASTRQKDCVNSARAAFKLPLQASRQKQHEGDISAKTFMSPDGQATGDTEFLPFFFRVTESRTSYTARDSNSRHMLMDLRLDSPTLPSQSHVWICREELFTRLDPCPQMCLQGFTDEWCLWTSDVAKLLDEPVATICNLDEQTCIYKFGCKSDT